jgi:4-azaleucine resistance transporter AzlC
VNTSIKLQAFRSTFPVFWGYVAGALAFGLLVQKMGYSIFHAAGSGLFLYAGSAQLLMLRFIETHESLIALFVAVLVLNLRHFFYGLGLYHRYKKVPWATRWYLIFGITDETFALLSSSKKDFTPKEDREFLLWVTMINQSYWVFGCALGAAVGSYFTLDLKALDFVLPALFIVLLVNYIQSNREYRLAFMGAVAGLIAIFCSPAYMLPIGLCLVFIFIALDLMKKGKKHA